MTSQVLIIISHMIKLFHNTSKSTCEDRLVHFEERKKGVHLLIFMKPPIMQVCFLVRLFDMFVFGYLPSLIL